MDPLLVGLIALGTTLFLLAIRVPIAAALGISASIGIFIIFSWRPGRVRAAIRMAPDTFADREWAL